MIFSEYNTLISDVINIIDSTKIAGKKFTDIFKPNLTIEELYYEIKRNNDLSASNNMTSL